MSSQIDNLVEDVIERYAVSTRPRLEHIPIAWNRRL
jgi:hypothetical protein